MTRRGDGTCTVRKTRPCVVSSMPLLPVRKCCSSFSFSGSVAMSAALTRRCAPLATSVTTTAPRRAARSAFSAERTSSRKSLLHLLDQHPNGAAAGQAHLPGGLIRDAELEQLWLPALDDVDRLGHHGALDAAAGDGAEEIALIVDDQIGTDRPRRRAPGLDHRGERHTAPGFAP